MAGCTLEDCLKRYFVAEHVENYRCSNCWHTAAIEYVSISEDKTDIEKLRSCNRSESCECKRVSSLQAFPWSNRFSRTLKQLSIAHSPKILCIHFQRASYNVLGQSMKLRGHVSFPSILNLSPFVNTGVGIKPTEANSPFVPSTHNSHRKTTVFPRFPYQMIPLEGTGFSEAAPREERSAAVAVEGSPRSGASTSFRLVSVVEHFGSSGGGHYTVYRKVRGKIGDGDPVALLESGIEQWFSISDSEVDRVSEREVFDANASMLFYEKLDCD